jgi:hypothetical protein
MRIIGRGLGVACAGLALLGVVGCAESNEKASGITSGPTASGTPARPSSPEDYYKQQQQSQRTQFKQSGYPGAK